MTNWVEKLNDAWEELFNAAPVARHYRTKLLSAEVPLNILAAVRAVDNAPCLILQATVDPDSLFEVGGMRLQVVPDNSGPLLVLSLEDESRRDLFSTICSDVVSVASQENSSAAFAGFISRLDAWRQFLRDRRSGLSRSETIGLIGELIILDRLLLISPELLSTWAAPDDGLHDFHLNGRSLEVKSTMGPASFITISRLDQLETLGLRQLDLLYVRLIEATGGKSLQTFIDGILSRLFDGRAKQILKNGLLRRGLMPDDNNALNTPMFELRAIDAYTVSDDFPRLLRATLPIAIVEATYKLEVRSLAPFSADADAVLNAFAKREIS